MSQHDSLWRHDATELAALIRSGQVSAREAVEAHLARLDAVNPAVRAVVRALHEEARAAADEADRRQRAGDHLGPLHGVPVTTKISTDQRGLPTDHGVLPFRDLLAPDDAPVIRNLRRAGAIVIGRTNSPAFAMRFTTDNRLHGLTRNPWNPAVTCGGSSGGAGAATAAGIGAFAQGTDIGGSIRWPAFCNGIVGLRPTPGRIPSAHAALAVSTPAAVQMMSVSGPMTRSVRDARLALQVMASTGDARDPLWIPAPLWELPPRPRRAALVTEHPGIRIHPAAVAAVREAGRRLAAAGWVVEEALPPHLEDVGALWERLALHEIRAIIEPLLDATGDDGLATALRAWWGDCRPLDLPGYHRAVADRHTLGRQWSQFLEETPIVVMPAGAAPSAAFDQDVRPGGMRWLLDHFGRFLFPAPVLGLPALAVPVGQHEGLPQGVQIHAARFREDMCLEAGEVIEAWDGPRQPIDPRS